jgi:hypothetical protein
MGYLYQTWTARRHEEERHRDAEAEIAASLIASQTLLEDAANTDGRIPTFTAVQNPPFGRQVHEMTMETADGGKENIDISYSFLGNLDQINIDKDGDGKADSKFVRKSGWFGSEIEYYANADGKLTARGISDNGRNLFDSEVHKVDFEKPNGEPIGSVQIEDTFWARPGLLHVMKDGQEVAMGHIKKGQFREILSIGNGESRLHYRLEL